MNTPDRYERHSAALTLPEADPAATTRGEVPTLATHQDPSIRTGAKRPARRERLLTWIRPSDLPTTLGTELLRRGIGLQAGSIRQVRRASAVTASAVRRSLPPLSTDSAITAPLTTPTIEGREL